VAKHRGGIMELVLNLQAEQNDVTCLAQRSER
jgi:hypothetical protein